MLPSVSVPTPTAARLAAIAAPVPSSSRRGCGRAHTGCSSVRRGCSTPTSSCARAEVGPLAEVRLAEDHRPGRAQAASPAGHRRAGGARANASEPAELTTPTTSMLSLISTGIPVQRPAHAPSRALAGRAPRPPRAPRGLSLEDRGPTAAPRRRSPRSARGTPPSTPPTTASPLACVAAPPPARARRHVDRARRRRPRLARTSHNSRTTTRRRRRGRRRIGPRV